ncbi:MAG TPA: PQQ-binding-like beta-propeller repeat protein, partial [Tepidisphaeraceae bacterium]|nr:PQQ-binding-like beta-propeller repeat protein [Tepidisphaeraceae bacterium]
MKPNSIFLSSIIYLLSSFLAGCGQNGNVRVGSASADRPTQTAANPGDWYRWRGPEQNGLSRQKNLPSEWAPPTKENPQGKNIIWTNDIGGMSSPIVMNSKLYTLSRVGEQSTGDAVVPGPHAQETFVCVDANTGNKIWEHRENMTQTDDPFWRIGWSNPAGDPQTGRVYALGAQCTFLCLDGNDGHEIWKRQMTEEFGLISTFGGRTPSPAIDEDQVIIAGVAFGWGDNARGQHRVFAFNKNTGQLNWTAGTGFIPSDAPQNTPVIAVINGQRLVMLNTGDGGVHAWKARTGEKVFQFAASKRGMNSSLVVDGTRIFVCTDLDNFDSTRLGRIACIDAASADMNNPPREIWRQDGVEAGFPTPVLVDGILYVADDYATIYAIDVNHPLETKWPGTEVKKAKVLWKKSFGRIGKGSPVFADGKIYFGEANGRVSIIKPTPEGPQVLSTVELTEKPGREYVIYGSPAVANGRVIIQAASKTYCIGNKDAQAAADPIPQAIAPEPAADAIAAPAVIQVVPADVLLRPGQKQTFTARAFDAKGRFLKEVKAEWSVGQLVIPPPPVRVPEVKNPNGPKKAMAPATMPATAAAPPGPIGNLKGEVTADGAYTALDGPHMAGGVYATVGGVKGFARVRVMPPLPWKFDFEQARVGAPPFTWTGAGGKFSVQDQNGNKVLTKLTDIPLYARARTNFGSVDMVNYTLQADVKVKETLIGEGDRAIRKAPDPGIINQRYVLELLGTDQKIVLHIWPTALPYSLNHTIPYQWKSDTWYRLKLQVQQASDKAIVKGKVWPADQP